MVASINASTSAGVVTTADTSGILQLQTASTAALTIDASQNSTFAGSVKTNTLTSASATALTLQSAGTTAITVDTSQNVGIGTASPAQKFEVVGASSTTIIKNTTTTAANGLNASNTGGGFYFGLDSSAGTFYGGGAYNRAIYSDGAYPIVIYTNSAERMRIDSSGNLLVGTTSASSPFDGCKIAIDTSGDCMRMRSGGTVIRFIATGTSTFVGSITTTGSATAYNTSSDYRLKENIAPMTGALSKVALLKPVTYKWKVDGSDGEGFIAHELAEVKPDCVSGDKDAVDADGKPQYQGIDTSFLVATLTAALQETKALIDTQAETINALTARIVALEQA